MIRLVAVVLLSHLAVGAAAAGPSLPSPESLRSAAVKTAGLIEQYRQILRDPDANVRLAAFTQLARVDDPVIRQIAYEEGFASSDKLLRAMALKFSLFDRKALILESPDSDAPPATFAMREEDLTTGDFSYTAAASLLNGRVQGLSVHLGLFGGCTADLNLNDEDKLLGEQRCPKEKKPVQIDLRGS